VRGKAGPNWLGEKSFQLSSLLIVYSKGARALLRVKEISDI
jgi:hypothetical protein